MLKWLVTVLVVLIVLAIIAPRFGAWRLPGDFSVPVRGRIYYIPLASTVVFSLLIWLIGKLL
jgi:hypothetical protein